MEAKWKQNGTFGTFRFKPLMGLKRRNKQENQRVTRFSPRGCYCTFRFTPLNSVLNFSKFMQEKHEFISFDIG